MNPSLDSPTQVTLYTLGQKPLLEGKLRHIIDQALRTLPKRYPGLKIVSHAVFPDRVEMVLDLQRLDEDLTRIVQSFKSDVKGLAKKAGFTQHALWQWSYEEKEEK